MTAVVSTTSHRLFARPSLNSRSYALPPEKRTAGLGRVAVDVVLQKALIAVRVKSESDASVEEEKKRRGERREDELKNKGGRL